MPQAKYQESPVDTMGARLDQASAVLAAISGSYCHESQNYTITEATLNHAIWAIDSLLEQGRDAYQAFLKDQNDTRVVSLRRAG
jgi:hypothetical protein